MFIVINDVSEIFGNVIFYKFFKKNIVEKLKKERKNDIINVHIISNGVIG